MRLDFSNAVSSKILKDFFKDFRKQYEGILSYSVLDAVSFIGKRIKYGVLSNFLFIDFIEINKVDDFVEIDIVLKNTNLISIKSYSLDSISIKIIDNVNKFLVADFKVSGYSSIEKILMDLVYRTISLKNLNSFNHDICFVKNEKDLLNILFDIQHKLNENIIVFMNYHNFLYDSKNKVFKNGDTVIQIYRTYPTISLGDDGKSISVSINIRFRVGDIYIKELPYTSFLKEFLLYIK